MKKLKKKRKKQEEARKKSADLGFSQRRNRDYNIVYREKPTKPLTVNELFGIKPKKRKKGSKKEEPKVMPKEESKEIKPAPIPEPKVETKKKK